MHHMLHGRCDESYNGDIINTPIYVVAGFVAELEQWEEFDSMWTADMRALHITSFGLHASKCENGKGPYQRMSEETRREIQHRMIVDIGAAELFPCVAIADLEGYRKRRDIFSNFLGNSRRFNEPHILTTRNCILLMLQATRAATREALAIVADRNKAYGKRVLEWYQHDRANEELDELMGSEYRRRLGPIVEDDRMQILGLQAADLLAYAAFRKYNGAQSPWQWDEIEKLRKPVVMIFGEEFWRKLEDRVGAS
jgi:hypothetical protein